MNFQDLLIVESADTYLDQAIKQATKRIQATKHQFKGSALEKSVRTERERLKLIGDALAKSLDRIPERFPNLDTLPEFYAQMIGATLDEERLKKALGGCSSGAKNVKLLAQEHIRRLRTVQTREQLMLVKRQAIGRIASVINRLDKSFSYLEKARKVMRDYPAIKPELFTVAIAGFPNVGKSTLLSKLTPSKPEIKSYAFTTKTLNVGYLTHNHNKIQFIDTPGTLSRPEKMNTVEKQAYMAIRYVANLVVYVYDLSEPFPLADQRRLEKEVRAAGHEMIIYLSKSDILDKELLAAFAEKMGGYTSVDELVKRIQRIFEKEFLNL